MALVVLTVVQRKGELFNDQRSGGGGAEKDYKRGVLTPTASCHSRENPPFGMLSPDSTQRCESIRVHVPHLEQH